jgi:penicillin-binding protein-related factor A (putative recombinase)
LIFSAKNESEKYLLGRYLLSPKAIDTDLDRRGDDFSKYVDKLDVKISEYDMRYIFQAIRSKMFYISGDELDYYRFMTELALLDRLELAEFKKRFSYALKKGEEDSFNINRMISENTRCGFVFICLQNGDRQDRIKLSKEIIHFAKYDMKLEKTLGITFIKESKDIMTIYWTYVSYPWEFNEGTEKTIKETDLFSPLKYRIGNLYKFKP